MKKRIRPKGSMSIIWLKNFHRKMWRLSRNLLIAAGYFKGEE